MQLFSCATIPDYKPIVDTSSVSDSAKYQKDYQECETITNNVDYSDEKTVAALKGAAVGAGVVGVGVASTLAAGGVVLAPVVIPIYAAAALVGGQSNSSKTNAEEQKMRALVWNSCLKDRGYKVFSDPNN
tara:strand:- start:114 stop:503 length:390 start_codon:yes stop_codon:yes gene_type:complete